MRILDIFNRNKKPTEQVAAMSPKISSYSLPDRGVSITDDDIKSLRPLIYGEVSNRGTDKKKLETNVILNTAINRMKEYDTKKKRTHTLSEVLAMPNQYQAYGGSQYQQYSNPPDPVAAAKRKEVDAIVDEIVEQLRRGQYPDNTEGAYYYIHEPDGRITYDNRRPLFAK